MPKPLDMILNKKHTNEYFFLKKIPIFILTITELNRNLDYEYKFLEKISLKLTHKLTGVSLYANV